MLEFDDEVLEDEEVFPLAEVDEEAFLLWRETHARELVDVLGGDQRAEGRWMRRRADPRLVFLRLRVRFTLWWEGVVRGWEHVDWPLVRRGLFAFACSFVFMMLLQLRGQGYHILPQLTIPFELPRDSYLRRLQSTFRLLMILLFKILCTIRGTSAVIAVLVGLGMDVGRWDFFNQDLPPAALPEHNLPVGVRGRVRWVPLMSVMVIMVGAIFLFNPTAQDQEPPPT